MAKHCFTFPRWSVWTMYPFFLNILFKSAECSQIAVFYFIQFKFRCFFICHSECDTINEIYTFRMFHCLCVYFFSFAATAALSLEYHSEIPFQLHTLLYNKQNKWINGIAMKWKTTAFWHKLRQWLLWMNNQCFHLFQLKRDSHWYFRPLNNK